MLKFLRKRNMDRKKWIAVIIGAALLVAAVIFQSYLSKLAPELAGDITKYGLEVDYPNGGEVLEGGDTIKIEWRSIYDDKLITVYLVGENAQQMIIAKKLLNETDFTWTIPENVNGQYKIKVRAGRFYDKSDEFFTISGTSEPPGLIENEAPFYKGDSIHDNAPFYGGPSNT